IWIRSIRWHRHEDKFFTASQDGSVALWRPPTGGGNVEELARVDLGIGPIWEATWTPTGQIACVSEQGQAALFSPAQPDLREAILLEANSWLRGIAWDPRDRYFVASSVDGWLECRASTRPHIKRWRTTFPAACFACAVHPDGDRIAVALGNGEIAVVDASSGAVRGHLIGHDSEVWSLAFSREGTRLLSGGADGTVRVWAFDEAEELRSFSLTTSCVSVRFSYSGMVLFGSSGAWVVDPDSSDPTPGSVSTTLTDSPFALLDEPAVIDMLRRDVLVDELAFFLHRTADRSAELAAVRSQLPDGFLVHVGGRWGSGKTTLARHLVQRVRSSPKGAADKTDATQTLRRWKDVDFSAWSHAGLGPAWWAIATTVRRCVVAELGWFERRRFAWREVNWRFPNLVLKIGAVIALSCFLIGFALALWAGGQSVPSSKQTATSVSTTLGVTSPSTSTPTSSNTLEERTNILRNLALASVPIATGVGLIVKLVHDARAKWRWPRQAPGPVELHTDTTFGELPRQYIEWLRRQAECDILLVVDDLDRCLPNYVVEVLSAVHLMSRAKSSLTQVQGTGRGSLAILVLGDTDTLEQSVETVSGLPDAVLHQVPGKRYGAAYLEKLFITSVQLPALLISQRLAMVKGAGQLASMSLARVRETINPRPRAHVLPATERLVTPTPPESNISAPQTVITQGVRTNVEVMHGTIEERIQDLARLAEAEAQLIEDYAALMDVSPRGVKRTLVGFWINRAIGQSLPCEPPLGDEEIMRWTILALRWPTLLLELRDLDVTVWQSRAKEVLGRQGPDFESVVSRLDLERLAPALLP
ncbi:MAG: P-loop NTPase fold protein, partial [Gammaproteobacteria bacterium]